MLVFIQLATMSAGCSFPPILGFHVTSEKLKLNILSFYLYQVKAIVKHISVEWRTTRRGNQYARDGLLF